MMAVRTLVAMTAALVLMTGRVAGQNAGGGSPASSPEAAGNSWSFSASAYTFLVPDSENYVNPNFTADHDWLHLEARYNYEAQKAGSVWVGHNFTVGDRVELTVTPMVGGVVGNLAGVAPGCNWGLSFWKLELSSQNEYVFDLRDKSGNFLYTWSELSYSPVEWFRTGLVVQRTKAYKTDFDVQRGVLAGFSYKNLDIAGYVFNFGWTDPTVVLAVTVNF
jgi:hypothetical protein